MNIYFDTKNKKDCNGCGICSLRCPKKAITMKKDKEGFLYPVIAEEKCIKCGLCKKICSNQPEINNFKSKVYAIKNKNEGDRIKSTSGGMFKVLVNYVIEENGVVAGVKYDENLNVIHSISNNKSEVEQFSISKYVRSDLNDIFNRTEQELKLGKLVLFSGTPCQNYALRKFLRKDYDNLILCEIICHSNPSPLVYELFKKNIELENNKKINKIFFRNKNQETGCNPYVVFEDNTKKVYTEYNQAFNELLISRPSCSNCSFCDTNRKSDITIGDFWGIDYMTKNFNDLKGVSIVCINTKCGEKIFELVKDKVEYIEISDIDQAFKYNHYKNLPVSKNRKKFFDGISKGIINENNIISYMKKYTKVSFFEKVVRKIKRVLL